MLTPPPPQTTHLKKKETLDGRSNQVKLFLASNNIMLYTDLNMSHAILMQ